MTFNIKMILTSDPNVYFIISNVVQVKFEKFDEYDPGFLSIELIDDLHFRFEADLWKIVSIW